LEAQTQIINLQNSLVSFFKNVFNILNTEYLEEFPASIIKQDTIFDKLKKEEERKNKIDLEDKKIDLTSKKINFYINLGLTREEAIEKAQEDINNIFLT